MKLIDDFGNLHSLYLCLLCLFMIFIGIYGESLISSTCTNTNIYTYFRVFSVISSISLTLVISYLICRIRCYKDDYHILSVIKGGTDIKVPIIVLVFCITQLSILLTLKSQISSCTDHDTSTFDVCAQIGLVGIGIAGLWCVYIFVKRIYLWNLKREAEMNSKAQSTEEDDHSTEEDFDKPDKEDSEENNGEELLLQKAFHSDQPDVDSGATAKSSVDPSSTVALKDDSVSSSNKIPIPTRNPPPIPTRNPPPRPNGILPERRGLALIHASAVRAAKDAQHREEHSSQPATSVSQPVDTVSEDAKSAPQAVEPVSEASNFAQTDNWTRQTDPATGRAYYWNKKTGESVWDDPMSTQVKTGSSIDSNAVSTVVPVLPGDQSERECKDQEVQSLLQEKDCKDKRKWVMLMHRIPKHCKNRQRLQDEIDQC